MRWQRSSANAINYLSENGEFPVRRHHLYDLRIALTVGIPEAEQPGRLEKLNQRTVTLPFSRLNSKGMQYSMSSTTEESGSE